MKKYFIYQCRENDCGFTALKMLLAKLSNNKAYLYLRNEKDDKYSFLELKTIAKNYGVIIEGFNYIDKNTIFDEHVPFIANINLLNHSKHSVLVNKIGKHVVEIYDPDIGIYKLTKRKFLKIFDGNVLLVEDKNIIIMNYKHTARSFYKVGHLLTLTIIKVFTAILPFCAMFFITNEFNFILPVILMTIYVIFEIMSQKYIAHFIKKTSSKFSSAIYSENIDIRKKKMMDLTTVNTGIVAIISSICYCSITILIISYLLIINEFLTIGIILIICLISCFNCFFINPILDKTKNSIKVVENALFSPEIDKMKFINLYGDLNKKITRFVSKLHIIQGLITITIFLLSLLLGGISSNFTLNYVVFFFLLFIFLYQNLNKFFMIKNDIKTHQRAKSRLNDVL